MLKDKIAENLAHSSRGILLILPAFFLLLLPALAQVATYHSDEHYYTDSAIYMLNHHDTLNPRYTDGALRTNKPILTYWAIMLSYILFGINFFAARLPFLIMGSATLWLTYLTSLKLFKKRPMALLATVILASNNQFIVLSLRATPDILQTLFINISLYGFVALIFNKDQRFRNYLLAYCGAALAVETKGLLGITPVVFAFLFVVFSRDKAFSIKNLIHWPVISLAFVIGASWYAYIAFEHGYQALGRFYTDQIGGKLGGSQYYILINIKDYAIGIIRNFFPWSLVLLAGIVVHRKAVSESFQEHKREFLFCIGWFGVLFLIFMSSSDCRTRYLIPAYPLLAILSAAFLEAFLVHSFTKRVWKWCAGFILTLISLCWVMMVLCGILIDWRCFAAPLVVMAAAGAVLFMFFRDRHRPSPIWLGVLILSVLSSVRWGILPLIEFTPSKQLTECILSEKQPDQEITVWATKRENYTRQTYVLSQGQIFMRYFPRMAVPEDLDQRSPVILTEKDRNNLNPVDYSIEPCGRVFRTPEFQTIWKAVLHGEKDDVLNAMSEPLYLALRKSSHDASDRNEI